MTLSNEHYIVCINRRVSEHPCLCKELWSLFDLCPHSECSPSPLDPGVGAHPLAPLAQEFEDLGQDSSKQHLDTRRGNTGH